MAIVDIANAAIFGSPPSAGFKPSRSGVRDAFAAVDTALAAAATALTTGLGTKAGTSGSGVNASAFRSALGLGAAALLAIGTTAGTAMAGDDARVVNAFNKDGSVAMTGPLTSPQLWTVQDSTQSPAGDYGPFVRANIPVTFVQGTATTPITTDDYTRPMVYFERHVAGRQSQPTSGSLVDEYLDSNWFLSPTVTVQTVVGNYNGSNANAGVHSRVMSTGIGTAPTATNPGQLNQAGVNGSVNCLCAYVGTVHTNGVGAGKARPAWAINSELRWTTGAAPDNMVGMEIDLINTGGKATSHIPFAGNNFTGIWAQSAGRTGTSDSDHRAATTAFYVSSDVAYTGWMSAMTVTARIYNYGVYLQNNLAASTATGVYVGGTSWAYGVNIDCPIATAGLRVNNSVSTSATGLAISGGFNYGASIQVSAVFGAVLIENSRNAGGANGISVNVARANDDTLIFNMTAAGNSALFASGSTTNPIRMRVNGSLRQISSATLGSLAGGNEVLYCI